MFNEIVVNRRKWRRDEKYFIDYSDLADHSTAPTLII
jgi:hypothetical protein